MKDIAPEQWQAFFKFRADDETHRACIEALSDPDTEMSKWLKLVQKKLRRFPPGTTRRRRKRAQPAEPLATIGSSLPTDEGSAPPLGSLAHPAISPSAEGARPEESDTATSTAAGPPAASTVEPGSKPLLHSVPTGGSFDSFGGSLTPDEEEQVLSQLHTCERQIASALLRQVEASRESGSGLGTSPGLSRTLAKVAYSRADRVVREGMGIHARLPSGAEAGRVPQPPAELDQPGQAAVRAEFIPQLARVLDEVYSTLDETGRAVLSCKLKDPGQSDEMIALVLECESGRPSSNRRVNRAWDEIQDTIRELWEREPVTTREEP